LRNHFMDYLTNFYKNKAQVLSEQIQILEAKLARLHEDAPASTFSGSGKGQQTFSDQQLRDQMKQHKRTGLFGAEISRDKQSQEYRDAEDELSRRSSAGKPAQQQSGNQQRTQAPASQPKPQQAAPAQTPKAQPSQPSQPKFDASQVYTGDDSWLSNATAPAKLPSSFAGDRGDSGTSAKSSDPMRHYGEPGVLPAQEKPKFDVLGATKNLLDQMDKKRNGAGSAPSSPAPSAPAQSAPAAQRTPAENAAQVEADAEARANRGMPESESQRKARLAKQEADRNANAARVKADSEARATRGMKPQGEAQGETKDQESLRLAQQQAQREMNAARVKADSRARATRGMNYQNEDEDEVEDSVPAPTAAPEKPGLFGELGNAFANAGRALFGMPQEVSKSIGRRVY
jgi:hypothetical protein